MTSPVRYDGVTIGWWLTAPGAAPHSPPPAGGASTPTPAAKLPTEPAKAPGPPPTNRPAPSWNTPSMNAQAAISATSVNADARTATYSVGASALADHARPAISLSPIATLSANPNYSAPTGSPTGAAANKKTARNPGRFICLLLLPATICGGRLASTAISIDAMTTVGTRSRYDVLASRRV